MNTEKTARKLTGLTSNLMSSLPENEESLDSIRRVLGYNLRKNLQDISGIKLTSFDIDIAPPTERIQEYRKYAVSKLLEEDKELVQRIGGKDVVPAVGIHTGDIRLPVNPMEISEEKRWNQTLGEQIGPFLTEQGRTIWFDLYYYVDKLTVHSQNGNIPHFLFSNARRNHWFDVFESAQTVSLRAGHVWILGKLFNSGANDNEYVGFNINFSFR